jgi:hypothetical protein
MGPCETRYVLLVRLAWELRSISMTTLLVFPSHAEPVLYVPCRDGRREPVLAVQRNGGWLLVWRDDLLNPEHLRSAARHIAMGAAA